jgi:hypothetical protein
MARSMTTPPRTPSRASISSWDDDEITPVAEAEAPATRPPTPPSTQPSRRTSSAGSDDIAPAAAAAVDGLPAPFADGSVDTALLWRRMLAVQRRFRCYNSARMTAALESEEVEAQVRMFFTL